VHGVTLELNASTVRAEEEGGHRNLKKSTTAGVREADPWRGLEERHLTRKMLVWSGSAEGDHGGRNSTVFSPDLETETVILRADEEVPSRFLTQGGR
jgi:hypothetical protein